MAEIPKQMRALTTCNWPKTQRILNLVQHFSLAAIGSNVAGVQTVLTPVPKQNQLLIRVKTVAVNPTDWKHVDFLSPAKARIGCDYAGVVVKASEIEESRFSVGDRVSGAVHGGLYINQGSFAEYIAVDEDMVFKIPDNLTDDEAAGLGVSSCTAMLALNVSLNLPWPDDEKAKSTPNIPILIYSGATTAGLMMIQLAKLCGHLPIATCSPHSADLVKRYGAAATFDYHSSASIEEIRKLYPGIKAAVDCFSEGKSTEFCASVLTGNGGGEVVTLLPTKSKFPDVKIIQIMAYTLMGEPFQFLAPIGPKIPAKPAHRAAAARFTRLMPPYLESGAIMPLPCEKVDGGFNAISTAFEKLRKKEISGKKLIIEIQG